jgi:hypothetical protein
MNAMKQKSLFGMLSLLIVAALIAGFGFGIQPTAAQTNAQGADQADDFPIFLNITGVVTAISPTSLTVDNLVITVPSGLPLPPGITVGTTITIYARLTEDDIVIAITIFVGAPSPTPPPTLPPGVTPTATLEPTVTPIYTPTPEVTFTPTPSGTLTATPAITGTPGVTLTPPIIKGCGLPKAILALTIAEAYGIPLDELEFWHCNGHAYGVIARAYAIVFGSKKAGTTVAIVLDAKKKGKKWTTIIVEVDSSPEQKPVEVGSKNPGKAKCPPGKAKKGECTPAQGDSTGKGNGKKNK